MVRRRQVEGHHAHRERKTDGLDHFCRPKPGAARRERGHVALRIDGVDVHRAGTPRLRREALVLGEERRVAARISWPQLPVRVLRIDKLRTLRRIVVRQEHVGRHHRLRRVSVILFPIGEGKLHRLDQQVAVIRACRPHALEVEARHQRDRLQLGRSLGPEPAFEQLGVAEAQACRLLDPGLEAREVLPLEQAIALFGELRNRGRDVSPIETVVHRGELRAAVAGRAARQIR
jgi:hypothetical protein